MKPDPDGMNDDRAEWAQQAVDAFQLATNTDPENLLADLLCDLMHWADRNAETAGSFEAALARAQSNYEAETYDDEAGTLCACGRSVPECNGDPCPDAAL